MNILFIALTIFLTGMLNLGDYFIKFATTSSNFYLWLACAAFLWVASIPGWFFIMSHNRLSIVGILFALFSLVTTTMIGLFCFHEKLTKVEWSGFILAIVSLLLLSKKI